MSGRTVLRLHRRTLFCVRGELQVLGTTRIAVRTVLLCLGETLIGVDLVLRLLRGTFGRESRGCGAAIRTIIGVRIEAVFYFCLSFT